MFCPNCGTKNDDDALFCGSCGTKLQDKAVVPPVDNDFKPDIELVDMSSRLRTVDDVLEVTTKPIILDGDTGGMIEHFVYNVRTLERIGVSAVIIEDKTGLKKNSLFGTEVEQTQDSIENFSAKIRAGKRAQRTKDFMIIDTEKDLVYDMYKVATEMYGMRKRTFEERMNGVATGKWNKYSNSEVKGM